jgi:dTDP-glucose pyrophosphorylase
MELKTYRKHLLMSGSTVKEALTRLNILSEDAIVFIVNKDDKLIGSLTDGDIRRGLLEGYGVDDLVDRIIQPNPRYIKKGENNLKEVIEYRENYFRIIPILDKYNHVINVINFREIRSYLPIDAVIMAGGRGERLRPLTDTIPKPLLTIGEKPIIEHTLSRLALYGIDDFWISLNYLGKQIEAFLGNGNEKNIIIKYIWETEQMGTIGAVSKIEKFEHDTILVTNADLLTNIDYEHFYLDFTNKNADFSIVTIPYQVNVPYAVLETSNGHIVSFKEKPTYTYYSNGGIYLMKRSVIKKIPKNQHFNATDLMERLIMEGKKVISYPLLGYWLDIGKQEDLIKAKSDILKIKF